MVRLINGTSVLASFLYPAPFLFIFRSFSLPHFPPISHFLHCPLSCDDVQFIAEREEPQNEIITGHQTMIEGSTAEMVCSLCAKYVTWWKAEDVPNGRQAGTFLIGGHVLRLGSLHIRDSGQYCCHGNNTEGTVQQACTQLEVLRTSKLTVYIIDCMPTAYQLPNLTRLLLSQSNWKSF